ncbi:MAG: hypothetical protein OXI87_08030 [Albidovulum sp.]|nr:hypothetical protein [Albidovulum sp.]MDE0534598.1 hypothetical protein [Albidovulum sp.]
MEGFDHERISIAVDHHATAERIQRAAALTLCRRETPEKDANAFLTEI